MQDAYSAQGGPRGLNFRSTSLVTGFHVRYFWNPFSHWRTSAD